MVMVPIYRYTVWRNSDDKLLALDVLADEAAQIMGMSRMSLDHLFYTNNGRNGTWTVTKMKIKEIEEQMREGTENLTM